MVFGGKTGSTQMAHHSVDDMDSKPATYHFDYQALFIANAAEIVGTTLVVMTVDSWGRIPIQWISYLISGIAVLVMCMLALHDDHDQYRALLVMLAFVARMLTMAASCTSWVSTAEVLTTEIRATGHAAANSMARLGGFFCPYIVSSSSSLSTIGYSMLIVGCFASFSAFHIPETMGIDMGGHPIARDDEKLTTKSKTKEHEKDWY